MLDIYLAVTAVVILACSARGDRSTDACLLHLGLNINAIPSEV